MVLKGDQENEPDDASADEVRNRQMEPGGIHEGVRFYLLRLLVLLE